MLSGNKKINIFLGLLFGVFTSVFGIFFFPVSTEAVHLSPTPCEAGDSQGGGGLPSSSGPPPGLFVPVWEAVVAANTNSINQNANAINQHTASIRYYLRQLCNKEYQWDHSAQHAWQRALAKYINRVMLWVNNAYGGNPGGNAIQETGNPIFVTNPHVYYKNIDYGIILSMMGDIKQAEQDGRLDPQIGRIMRRTLELRQIDQVFPDYIAEQFTGNNKAIWENPQQFTWYSWVEGSMLPTNNVYNVSSLVEREYEMRRAAAHNVETQKLEWGRGFFPWETCGQEVFSNDARDIRTCETRTPASTIQDLTSLVVGSAIRQMEINDEYEEWISETAFFTANIPFTGEGLKNYTTEELLRFNDQNALLSPNQAETKLGEIDAEDRADRKTIIDAGISKEKPLKADGVLLDPNSSFSPFDPTQEIPLP